ncbi:MAG TPA: urease accessory protein UreE [Pedobacter sp.]|jgi:urease accessory protein
MLIQQKQGNLNSFDSGNRRIDRLPLEWYEASKRILHKRTESGKEVIMKFLGESQNLTQDDVLYYDENLVIAIDIMPCDAIIIRPKNMFEMASVCYEIGNKHLPLFFNEDEVLVVFEQPLFRLLSASGYEIDRGSRKLVNPLKTTVAAHGNNAGGETLFSKIMKLTGSSE